MRLSCCWADSLRWVRVKSVRRVFVLLRTLSVHQGLISQNGIRRGCTSPETGGRVGLISKLASTDMPIRLVFEPIEKSEAINTRFPAYLGIRSKS